jgi:hypothetical protein
VGKFEEAQSMSCGISKSWKTPQALEALRRLPDCKEELVFEKAGLWDFSLFFPAESEATGTKINSRIKQSHVLIDRKSSLYKKNIRLAGECNGTMLKNN